MQENEVCHLKQVVYAQPRIRSGEWDAQSSLGFWGIIELPNLGQTTRPWGSEQKKKRGPAE